MKYANDNLNTLASLLAAGVIRIKLKAMNLGDFGVELEDLVDAFQYDSRMEAQGERVWVRVVTRDGRRFDHTYLLVQGKRHGDVITMAA